jgi:hypothetical protein
MSNNLRDDVIDILESVSKAQLSTLRKLRRLVRQETATVETKPVKSMSQIDMAYSILRRADRPMHISEIMSLVAKRYGVTLDRESIVSAISKRVARKDRFTRTGPNVFAALPDTER